MGVPLLSLAAPQPARLLAVAAAAAPAPGRRDAHHHPRAPHGTARTPWGCQFRVSVKTLLWPHSLDRSARSLDTRGVRCNRPPCGTLLVALAASTTEKSPEKKKKKLDPKNLGYKRNLREVYNLPDPSCTVPLGTGSYGVVNRVTKKSTGEEFALKSIPKQPPNERESKSPQSYLEKLVSEVKVMQHIGSSLNVVYLYDVFEDETHIHLVMELCRGGELWTRIKQGSYSEEYASRIMRSILQIIAQCHKKNVIYRDVKPDNFLFVTEEDDSPLKATDFGLATYFKDGETLTRRCGTPSYLAPEVVRRSYGPEADLWSAGITLYQLLSGRLPFKDARRATVKDVLRAVVEDEIDLDDHFWTVEISASARSLVKGLLNRNPEERLTAAEALNHPWINQTGIAPTTPLDGSIVQRLQRFGTFPQMKRKVLRFIAPSILERSDVLDTVVQAKQLLEIFNRFDYHNQGELGNEDLLKGLQESGYNVTADEVHNLVSAVDVEGHGSVSYEEFLTTMIDWAVVEQHDREHFEQVVNDMFDVCGLTMVRRMCEDTQEMDADKKGAIDRKEVKGVVCSLDMSPEECEALVSQAMETADKDGDGLIGREDFHNLLHTDSDDSLRQYASRAKRLAEDELDADHLDPEPASALPTPTRKTGLAALLTRRDKEPERAQVSRRQAQHPDTLMGGVKRDNDS